MAEGAAVTFLISQLSSWISQERQLQGSLGEQAESILEEMSRIRSFLRVADEKQEVDPHLKEWVSQVRDIAYDVEDVIDKYTLRFAARQADGRIKQICDSVKNLRARRRLASEMQAIQARLKRISEGQLRYKDIYGPSSDQERWCPESGTWFDSRGDALLLEEPEVVGIEKPKQLLVQWLTSTDHAVGLKVISVVGAGGLGKTTLVKRVYDDVAVKAHFTTHLWVTVSNPFKIEELLRTMIRHLVSEVKQLLPQGIEAMDADEMKEFVFKFLQHRRFIVVLDDIWRLSAWEAIRHAFPRTGTCGFVITTTRFHSIAQAASIQSNGHVYSLKPLSQEDSNTLFCKKAFFGGSCPGYLEEIAEAILKRCEGLPLAIVVISSLLATKNNDIHEWKKLYQRLGDELDSDHLRRMTKLLQLSYDDLPYYLKPCFMYLSIFPEDHIIYTTRLIHLWISEGFVQPRGGKTKEEVAEDYINELLDRSLIQVGDRSLIQVGGPPNYNWPFIVRVHDLVHAMIVSKSKEQNFVTIADGGGDAQWPSKTRRLAINGFMVTWADIRCGNHLRSLLVFDPACLPSDRNLSNLLRSCRQLKVFELESCSSDKIPDEVFKLYHLKYLSLRRTEVKRVPPLIGKLKNLETLDLRETKVTELPVEILRLKRLRHLMVYHYSLERGYRLFNNVHSFRARYRIGCFSSLQTLSDIDATEADGTTVVREIGKLTQLRELGIMKLRKEDGKDLCTSLAKLTSLESLYIASKEEDEVLDLVEPIHPTVSIRILELRGCLLKVPQWIASLHSLTTMLLRWSRVDDNPLESLQHLPSLMYLELSHAYEGSSLCFKASCFQRLKKLWIIRLERLERVKVEEGSMPCLQEFYMWGCKLVKEMPRGIEHLAGLQYVDFSDMSEGFVKALEDGIAAEGDGWKLGHVSKVEIYSLSGNGEWQGRRL